MEAESFFARWSRHKTETVTEAPDAATEPTGAEQPEQPPPTIEDVAALTPQSDYTRFIAKGVDEDIKRSALKKLFADPHFNIMDGLDTYIDDYNKFDPIPPEMLALLNHAKGLLDPLSQFEQPLMRLMESATPPEQMSADEHPASVEDAEEAASGSAEPQLPEPQIAESSAAEDLAGDTNPSAPNEVAPSPTITKPDDDHKI